MCGFVDVFMFSSDPSIGTQALSGSVPQTAATSPAPSPSTVPTNPHPTLTALPANSGLGGHWADAQHWLRDLESRHLTHRDY